MSFAAAVAGVAIIGGLVAPWVARRLGVTGALVAIGLVGPILTVLAVVAGTWMMAWDGGDALYLVGLAVGVGAASVWVAWRLARPLSSDLSVLRATTAATARGERTVRTGIVREDEVGRLAAQLDDLVDALDGAERDRRALTAERRGLVDALAHDLRTPLQALLATAEAVASGAIASAEAPAAVGRQVVTLETLLGDLVVLARLEAGTLETRPERLDLAELVDDAVAGTTPLALGRGVGLHAEVDGAVAVDVDPDQIARVLRNVIDNAVRHTPAGGEVRVVVTRRSGGAEVEVLDDGPGFAEDLIDRAFEPRVQGSGPVGGEGLGLAIARGLVLAHGGTLEALPGPGGRVRLHLPRTSGAPPASVGSAGSADPAARRPASSPA